MTPNSSGSSCGQSNASADVTPRTRSEPSIVGIALARSTSAFGSSWLPVAMTPRITPPERSCRVSARVSMSAMATMLVGDEVVAQRPLRAPVARHRRLVADDEAGDLRRARLDVVRRDAVVADLGAGHRDDLSGVGRIGQHFLIAGHAGVEHDLAARFALRARRRRRGTRCRLPVPESLPSELQSAKTQKTLASPAMRRSNDAVTRFCSPGDDADRRGPAAVAVVLEAHGVLAGGTDGSDSGVVPRSLPSMNTFAPGRPRIDGERAGEPAAGAHAGAPRARAGAAAGAPRERHGHRLRRPRRGDDDAALFGRVAVARDLSTRCAPRARSRTVAGVRP